MSRSGLQFIESSRLIFHFLQVPEYWLEHLTIILVTWVQILLSLNSFSLSSLFFPSNFRSKFPTKIKFTADSSVYYLGLQTRARIT